MTVSTRTPEGFPARCPLCGAATNLEFSEPSQDAPCPNCGHLLWFSVELLAQIAGSLAAASNSVTAETTLSELGADSLDTVELVMELEEEFDLSISDDVAERIQTIGDLIRFIEQQRRNRP